MYAILIAQTSTKHFILRSFPSHFSLSASWENIHWKRKHLQHQHHQQQQQQWQVVLTLSLSLSLSLMYLTSFREEGPLIQSRCCNIVFFTMGMQQQKKNRWGMKRLIRMESLWQVICLHRQINFLSPTFKLSRIGGALINFPPPMLMS